MREFFGYCLLEYFFVSFSLSSPSGTPIIWMLVRLMLSQSSLRRSSFVFKLFSLFCICIFHSSVLHLVCSSASCILLLAASSEFCISVIVFCISSYLSCISYISLVSVSCKLSIFASSLFPISCIIFSNNILNSFSWRLRISSSLS